MQPDPTLNVNLDNLDLPSVASNRALATSISDYLELPVTKASVRRFADMLVDDPYSKGKVSKYPLVGLPHHEILGRIFQEALEERDINWTPSLELDSLDLVAEYVVRGFGVGMGVSIPGRDAPAGLRTIRLTGFSPVVVGALSQGGLKPIARSFLQKAKKRARSLTRRK